MEYQATPQIFFMADLLIFAAIILMHIAKKGISTVYLYAAQSLIVSFLMIYVSAAHHSTSFIFIGILIFIIKVILVPNFFVKQIKKQSLASSANNYLNLPVTLGIIALITMITHTKFFQPLATLAPANENALFISIAGLFISLFLIINRKGALSQMVGVLSLENTIVSFAFAAGLEQGPGLELGIIFDIFVWIIIATTFVSMIYKKFNTLDVSVMTKLKG
jgi:hydrogenase-4 component E